MGEAAAGDELRGRLSQQDVAQLTEQIAGLSAAGLPLPSGLRALAEEQPSRRLRVVLNRLSQSLDAGESLDVALGSERLSVPKHVSGLVVAGLRTGRLGEVLGRFASFASLGADLRRHVWLSLLYPIITWLVATFVIGFMLVVLAGSFGSIFKDFGLALPLLTQFLLRLAEALARSWTGLAYFAVGVVAVAIALRASLSIAPWRSLVARLPLLGWVWRLTSLGEFCHLLALLLECEVPLGEAIVMTGGAVLDSDIDRACRAMQADVESGLRLSEAVVRRKFFPGGLGRILAWAEEHQSLPEALHMAGEMFESKAKAQAIVMVVVCNVLTVIAIILGIILVIGAIVAPLFMLLSALF